MNYNLILGVLSGIIAQVVTFYQLQGPLKYNFLKQHFWFVLLWGIPISYLFTTSVRNFQHAFNGELWPGRLIGFSIGTIVFTLMSNFIFDENINLKTWICLGLSLMILLVQIFLK
jgi:multidrug transporter EmrE-like cation transporter